MSGGFRGRLGSRNGGAKRRLVDRVLWALFRLPRLRRIRSPWSEHAVCVLLHPDRLTLPEVAIEAIYPEAPDVEVRVTDTPSGGMSTPLVDSVLLLKLVVLSEARRVLELGSYRGFTSKSIAEHLPEGGEVVAVDQDAGHGQAYRGLPIANRIERRVGSISSAMFEEDADGSFDLVFIDADHSYEAVRRDTELVRRLVAPHGWLVWHDYANWGALSGLCGVPEYLAELQHELPIAQIEGTTLAVHHPKWAAGPREEFERLLLPVTSAVG